MAKASQKSPPKQTGTTVGPLYRVTDLTGGVNLQASATAIKPEEARRLVGCDISSPGELGVYPGFVSHSTAALEGTRRLQGAKRIYISGQLPFTLAADNGFVYKKTDAGIWGGAVLFGLHTTNPVDFVYDRSIVAVFDGSNLPKKSKTGLVNSWSQLGIAAPGAPTLSAVAGGSLVSGHTYEVSYAYGDTTLNHYSNATATATQAVSGGNLTVRVATVNSGSIDVNSIKIYARDITAGETVRRLAATIGNLSTNTDLTTNNWDGQEEAPTDHNTALALSFGTVWKNRWWARDAGFKNRLRFTQIFQPQSWPTNFFIDIPFERGDDITAIIPIGDILVVFGFTRFYLIIGQTSLDFEVRPAQGAQTGAFGFRAVDLIENGVAHAGASGLYLFNGASDELLSYPIDLAWSEMVDAATTTDLELFPVVYHKQAKEVRCAVPSLYPMGVPGEWIMDLNRSQPGEPSWMSTVRNIGGYVQWDGAEPTSGNQGRIFSWHRTILKLFEERVGTTFDGANRVLEYDGYALPFGLMSSRVVDTYVECQPVSGVLTVNLKVDGQVMGEQSFTLGSDFARYGRSKYGSGKYAGGSGRISVPVQWPLKSEGRSAQFILKYVGTGDFKVFSYGHNVFSEKVPRGM